MLCFEKQRISILGKIEHKTRQTWNASYYTQFSTMRADQRLALIGAINPEWATTIIDFVHAYPEFGDHLERVPLRPREPIPYTNVRSLYEAILHYLCAAGVRYNYAIRQWNLVVFPLLAGANDWSTILANVDIVKDHPDIQPKKRDMYVSLCQAMVEMDITPTTLTMAHLKALRQQVKGVGDGCVAWCKKYFSNDDDCLEYTDIVFKKGFQVLYHTKSAKDIKAKCKEWQERGFGRIANLFVLALSP